MGPRNILASGRLTFIFSLGHGAPDACATHVVEIPISTVAQSDDGTRVNTIVMSWDQSNTPEPLLLQWGTSRVPVRGTALESPTEALDYAMRYYSMTGRPTGTVSLYTTTAVSLGSEGPSSGAALTVGFLALLRGDQLRNGFAITGMLEPSGRIGQVRNIGKKIRAAARQGYRVLLVPRGQMSVPRVKLTGIGVEPNVLLREVRTIDEGYEIMTGKRL